MAGLGNWTNKLFQFPGTSGTWWHRLTGYIGTAIFNWNLLDLLREDKLHFEVLIAFWKQESRFQVNGFGASLLCAGLAFGKQPYVMSPLINSVYLPLIFLLCCFSHCCPFILNLVFQCFCHLLSSAFQKFPVTFSQNSVDGQWSFVPCEIPSPSRFRLFSHSYCPSAQGDRLAAVQVRAQHDCFSFP